MSKNLKRGRVATARKEHPHEKHVRHLKRHRNVLYVVVMLLLAFQIFTLVSVSSQISLLSSQIEVTRGDIRDSVNELETSISDVQQESQFGITELTREMGQQNEIIMRQGEDIQTQIDILKATSNDDFSGIINKVITKVVNVRTDRSAGTGFIVNRDGYIVTNSHVIRNGAFVQIQLFDGSVYDAQVIVDDEFADLALLQIELETQFLTLANSNDIQVGEKVIAIGNPLGLSFTVTEGIVSATKRTGPNGLHAYVQTDVTLNPGNSGGPLINTEGNVIGVNNFKIGGAEALGFAVESNIVRERINMLANETIIS